jgi:hypothetical protein
MALEDQSVAEGDEQAQLERLTKSLIEKSSSKLWENR